MLAVAALIGLFIAVPFLMILVNSFKSPADYNSSGPLSLPSELYTDGLRAFWDRVDFPQKLWNSFVMAMSIPCDPGAVAGATDVVLHWQQWRHGSAALDEVAAAIQAAARPLR